VEYLIKEYKKMAEKRIKKSEKHDSPKADAQDIKREQILAGAEKLFTRYGYVKTTMDEIAEVAGLKKASIYYYYENKEAIFHDVVMQEISYFITEADKKVSVIHDPLEKIMSFCFYRLDYFQQFLNLHNLSIQIIREAAPFLKKLQKDFLQKEIDYLNSLLQTSVKAKIIKNCDTERIAGLILDISDAMKFKEFRKSDIKFISDIDYAKLKSEIRSVLDLILEGLKFI
jgi:AcrR family transcriptional regulator